jgi:hypothetical protein
VHQLLINFEEAYDSVKREVLNDIPFEFGIPKKKKRVIMRPPNSGKNQNMRRVNESLENVNKFKNLGTIVTNQHDIHDKIKSRLNLGNVCYHSVRKLLSSLLILNKLKTNFGSCAAWVLYYFSLREVGIYKDVYENRVLRIFGPKGRKTDRGGNCIMMNFITCIFHLLVLG